MDFFIDFKTVEEILLPDGQWYTVRQGSLRYDFVEKYISWETDQDGKHMACPIQSVGAVRGQKK